MSTSTLSHAHISIDNSIFSVLFLLLMMSQCIISEPKTKKVKETTWDWQLLNDIKAIWLRNPKEISDEDYANFFHSIAKVCTKHISLCTGNLSDFSRL